MPQIISTNLASLNAQRNLNRSQNALNTSLQRLSSGLRINSAKDDAAGLAITERMTSQIRGLNQAVRNANDGISVVQTAEGAMQEASNILQRMRELSIQSANDSNSAADRTNLQKEVVQLQNELNQISSTTTFNGKNLLDGTFTTQQFQVGSNANEAISVNIGNTGATALGAQEINGSAVKTHVGSALAAATDGTGGNGVSADAAFKITGAIGTQTLSIAAKSTAALIASQINGASASTGVTASASNSVTLDTLAQAGTISFTLSSQDSAQNTVGTAVNISATVTSTTDLSALSSAINAATAQTGITASLSASGAAITLSNSTGHDIVVANASNGDATDNNVLNVGGVTLKDNGGGGTNNDSIVVGGKVSLDGSAAFLVSTTNTDILAATSTSSTLNSVAQVDISSQSGANSAISVLDQALSSIADSRANLGAIQNRFESTIANLQTVSENVTAARSRIRDADFAEETANLTKNQILQQAGVAILSQANSLPQNVLSLLR